MNDKLKALLLSRRWPRDLSKMPLASVEFVDEWLNRPWLSGDFTQSKGFKFTIFDTRPTDAYGGPRAAMRRVNMRFIQDITAQFPKERCTQELAVGWDEYGQSLDFAPWVYSLPVGSPEIERVKEVIVEELTYAGITAAKVKAEDFC
jgi:hypothetical protein